MTGSSTLILTLAIIAVIAVMTLHALLTRNLRTIQNAPSILTSLGIFGTFLGITIGLAGFNPANIADSVPLLFSGIKLAFWTSVAGILGGILVKFRWLLFPPPGAEQPKATVGDMVQALEGVQRSLSDQDDSPLLGALAAAGEGQAAMTEALKQQGEDSQAAIHALRDSSDAGFKALAETSGEQMKALAESLGQSQEELLNRLQAAQLDELRQMREAIVGPDGAAAALGQRMQDSQTELATAMARAAEGLQGALGGELAKLAGQVGEAGQQQGQAMAHALESLESVMGKSASEQTEAIARVLENVKAAMSEDNAEVLSKLDAMRAGSDALGERLSAAMGGSSEALAKALESSRDAMAAQVTTAVTDLRDELVGPEGATATLGERLSKALDGSSEAVAARITTAVTELRDALVGPDGAASAVGARLQQNQADVAAAIARATEGLQATLGSDLAKLASQVDQAGGRQASAVSDALQSLESVLGESSKQQTESITRLLDNVKAAIGDDTEATLAQLEAMRAGSDSLGERLSKALGDNSAQIDKALAASRDAMAAQVTAAVTELRDALVGPDGASAAMASKLQAGQADLAAALGRSSEALAGSLGKDIGGLQARIDAMGEGLAGSISKDVGGLQDRIDAMGEGLGESIGGAFSEGMGGVSGDIGTMQTAIADAIDDLRLALVGPEGAASGIAEEIHRAQQDTGETLVQIRGALEDISKGQIDYSPKKLLEVLEDMIQQFNTRFSGQFWENFAGFNQGIAEAISWMDTYRKQITDMNAQHARTARHMDTAARRFDEVASRSEVFVDVARNIQGLLGGIDSQRVQMEAHIKQFAKLVDATRSSLDDIEQRIIDGNENMNKHVGDISERIEEQVIRLDSALDDELSKAMGSFGRQLSALSEKFVDDYAPLTERLREVVRLAEKV